MSNEVAHEGLLSVAKAGGLRAINVFACILCAGVEIESAWARVRAAVGASSLVLRHEQRLAPVAHARLPHAKPRQRKRLRGHLHIAGKFCRVRVPQLAH